MTLSGFVESQAQAEEAVKVAKGVEGVTSVSDKLHVRDAKEGSVKATRVTPPLPVKSKPNCWQMTLSLPVM